MKKTESFRSWLLANNRYTINAASSVLSRCRRVERDLALSLDASVRTSFGYAEVVARIQEELLTNESDKTRKEGQASLVSATRRYADFLAGRTDTGPM